VPAYGLRALGHRQETQIPRLVTDASAPRVETSAVVLDGQARDEAV
jgi:capsular polysaccharide biosynthesis protein